MVELLEEGLGSQLGEDVPGLRDPWRPGDRDRGAGRGRARTGPGREYSRAPATPRPPFRSRPPPALDLRAQPIRPPSSGARPSSTGRVIGLIAKEPLAHRRCHAATRQARAYRGQSMPTVCPSRFEGHGIARLQSGPIEVTGRQAHQRAIHQSTWCACEELARRRHLLTGLFEGGRGRGGLSGERRQHRLADGHDVTRPGTDVGSRSSSSAMAVRARPQSPRKSDPSAVSPSFHISRSRSPARLARSAGLHRGEQRLSGVFFERQGGPEDSEPERGLGGNRPPRRGRHALERV